MGYSYYYSHLLVVVLALHHVVSLIAAFSCYNTVPDIKQRSILCKVELNVASSSSAEAEAAAAGKEKGCQNKINCQDSSSNAIELRGSKPLFQATRGSFITISATAIMSSLMKSEAASAFERSSTSTSFSNPIKVYSQTPQPTPSTSSTIVMSATSPLTESISGFVAGGALTLAKTIVKYPLDTATVRLQTNSTYYSVTRPYPLFEDSFRGITTPLLTNIPAGAVFFAVKDATKQALKQHTYYGGGIMPKWVSTSLAVAVAQIPYWVVRNPSEVVKTRQQANVCGYSDINAVEAAKKIWEEERLRGLYSGFWENIFYAYPADVIKFVIYEALSSGGKTTTTTSSSTLSPSEGAFYGAFSTAAAQLITTPLDVVRNRVMAQGYYNATSPPEDDDDESRTSYSYIGSILKIAQTEGLKGLFAGATPRVGKAILSGAIQFATYEETKSSIANYFSTKVK